MYKATNLYKIGFLVTLLITASLLLAACGDSTAEKKEAFPTPIKNPTAGQIPNGTPGPVPGTIVKFPEDEAPHNNITEWWYYTGHLNTEDGQRYGFEYVIFQGIRADFPVGYASHFAISNEQNSTFQYDQRLSIATNFKPGGSDGFNLSISKPKQASWTMKGVGGVDQLKAAMDDGTYGIDLEVRDVKGIALHGGGQFSYGPSGSSYYYSRTRMEVSGTLQVGSESKKIVGGQVWFDKQWGNFLPLAGGWDWFSTQLDDGSEMMFYNLRDKDNKLVQVFGTYLPTCQPNCTPNKPLKAVDIVASDIIIKDNGKWKSPKTGISWPSGWTVTIKAKADLPAMELTYKPILPNQELDTRGSTATIYWEGDSQISGTKNGQPVTGSGYVELTGYDIGK